MTRSGGGTIEPEQRTTARVVGILYSATMGTAVFAELFLRGQARPDAAHQHRAWRSTA